MPPQAHSLWGLAVFPIYRRPSWHPVPAANLRYTPLREALENSQAAIVELAEAHVPEILVKNQGRVTVLGLDGDELVGGKQNRILNTSVLLAHGDTRIPVSCVEKGRWRDGASRHFSSGERLPHGLRSTAYGSVSSSLLLHKSYVSDQRAIWRDIEGSHARHGVSSDTASLHALYEVKAQTLQAYVEALPYPAHALGLAVAIGGRITGLDLFDQASTCEHYWPRLVRASAAEALSMPHTVPAPRELFNEIARCEVEVFDSPGLGQDVRFQSAAVQGSALVHQEVVVHLSMFVKES